MTFPSALAVGIEGLDEVMEVELAETTEAGKGDRPLLCADATLRVGTRLRAVPA